MGEPVLWLGGWASNLACWRPELESLYPGREHSFLDAHEAIADPSTLRKGLSALSEEGTLVAWSLGSLILHASLERGEAGPVRRMVSVSPIFDFCGSGLWPAAVVDRMIARLSRNRESVLENFLHRVKGETPLAPATETSWRRQSEGYSLETLVRGLEALRDLRADPGRIFGDERVTFLASPRDPMSPWSGSGATLRSWVPYPRGHLPFLEFPGLLAPLLSGTGLAPVLRSPSFSGASRQ